MLYKYLGAVLGVDRLRGMLTQKGLWIGQKEKPVVTVACLLWQLLSGWCSHTLKAFESLLCLQLLQ